MIKALYVNELGSGDAKTHKFECATYAEVKAIRPQNNVAGDTPLVRYKKDGKWMVATYRDESKNKEDQSWRDWDAVYAN